MRWSGASRSCRASNTWTSTPRTSRSACATTAPPEGPDRGMRDPPPATTAYPGGLNQFSPDAPARAHDFSLSSADDGLAALSAWRAYPRRSEEHTSELQSRGHLVCRLLLENKKRRTSLGVCG